jgi:hypothetical protein
MLLPPAETTAPATPYEETAIHLGQFLVLAMDVATAHVSIACPEENYLSLPEPSLAVILPGRSRAVPYLIE